MRLITTRMHGVADYLIGILLLCSPWLFKFSNAGTAQYVAMIAGAILIVMSFLTNYEEGIFKKIPLNVHFAADILIGMFLVSSPWILGFASVVFLPHLIGGILEIITGFFTDRIHVSHSVKTEHVNHAH